MHSKDDRTLHAAIRLFKSQMRKHVWTKRPEATYTTMADLEAAIEQEAQSEWTAALSDWNMSDERECFLVGIIVGQAFYTSLKDLYAAFDSAAAPALAEYARTHEPSEILSVS